MFLEEVRVTFIEPCTADANKMRFKAKFSRDISEILPYLNAQIKTAQYNHTAGNLTFNQGIKIITIYSDSLAVAKIINETEAYEMSEYIQDLINEIYEKKDDIAPLFETRKKPSAFEIYKYLPKTNCRKCGETTCLAFGTKLVLGQYQIEKCRTIHEVEYKEKLDRMMGILNC
ncbi:Fe-S cluster protein [Alkalibaculum sp. M08DMB]|uniref:Fe-S cluster protein n=1 Tax=Alkalibaculum sporogenes TaxID=2655001 RepID=A0A6A7KB87_9FIRM|nr:(Fe-S)-binding protein [Alkalibaculum sporogenes]MPW26800.1 Fe-S cluster protein [Alkalibaculum sporogenes]